MLKSNLLRKSKGAECKVLLLCCGWNVSKEKTIDNRFSKAKSAEYELCEPSVTGEAQLHTNGQIRIRRCCRNSPLLFPQDVTIKRQGYKLCLFCGRNDRIRTCDILLPKQARYQLRYIPKYIIQLFDLPHNFVVARYACIPVPSHSRCLSPRMFSALPTRCLGDFALEKRLSIVFSSLTNCATSYCLFFLLVFFSKILASHYIITKQIHLVKRKISNIGILV